MPWQETDDGIGAMQFTMAVLAVSAAVFIAELTDTNVAMLQVFPWRLGQGEVWRLLTSTLLHGSILHFLFNMVLFYRFSRAIERWLGPWLAMGVYVFVAVGAGAPQAVFSGDTAIGASGVVYGLFGMLWVCRRRYDIAAETVTPHVVQFLLAWLGICVVLNMFGGNIANVAHVFGLLFGWLVGQIVVATRRTRWPIVAGTVVLWGLLLSFTYAPLWARVIRPLPWLGEQYRFVALPQTDWAEAEEHLGRTHPGLF
ncbi:MAG: rhomboid family intramembrane serine protease [Tepidisphaeraceae bacterium]|jgi:membrane associated rhomboid family serine protease